MYEVEDERDERLCTIAVVLKGRVLDKERIVEALEKQGFQVIFRQASFKKLYIWDKPPIKDGAINVE